MKKENTAAEAALPQATGSALHWRDLEIGDIIQNGDRYIHLRVTTDGRILMVWARWETGPFPFTSHHPITQRRAQPNAQLRGEAPTISEPKQNDRQP